MNDIFFGIVIGAQLATFLLNAVLLFTEHRRSEVATRVFVATGCLMTMLTLTTIFDLIVRITPELTYGHKYQLKTIFTFLNVPFCVFVMMELTRYKHVTKALIGGHFAIPIVALVAYYVMLVYNLPCHEWVFYAYIVYTAIYIIWYVAENRRAVTRYERGIKEIYADTEGRSLVWFKYILCIFAIAAAIYFICIVFTNSRVGRYCFAIVCIFLWTTIACFIRKMRFSDSASHIIGIDEEILPENERRHDLKQSLDPEIDSTIDDVIASEFMESLNDVLNNEHLLFRYDLKREDVAKAMNTDYVKLTKYLRYSTGMTFSEYICDLRMRQAASLLANSDEDVDQIIRNCGYRAKSTFVDAFKEKYGCIPSEYREKKIKGDEIKG